MATIEQTVQQARVQARTERTEIPVPAMPYRWTGDSLVPLQPRRADQYLVIGEVYMLAPWEERSQASHAHEFAWLNEAWKNLPEELAEAYPSVEHLRKRALIQGGYFHETVIDVGSNAGATRTAAAVQFLDPFAYVIVRGGFVVVRRAESQSRRAMGKERFQASKTAILDIVSAMIGVEPQQLSAAATDGERANNPSPVVA